MQDAKVTFFDPIEICVWPYDQWPPERLPPFESWYGHEIEAAVLYNRINEANWSISPTHSTIPWNDEYTDVFDWMFSQSRTGIVAPPEPTPQPAETPNESAPTSEPESEPENGSFPIVPIIIVPIAAILVVAGFVLLRKKAR
jgi:hypothetical protein